MSNQSISKFQPKPGAPPLDPEIAAVYAESVQGSADVRSDSGNNSRESRPAKEPVKTPELLNQFERLQHIAEENQRNGVDRKAYADGSFDQVEHDVSNVIKIGFRLLTSD